MAAALLAQAAPSLATAGEKAMDLIGQHLTQTEKKKLQEQSIKDLEADVKKLEAWFQSANLPLPVSGSGIIDSIAGLISQASKAGHEKRSAEREAKILALTEYRDKLTSQMNKRLGIKPAPEKPTAHMNPGPSEFYGSAKRRHPVPRSGGRTVAHKKGGTTTPYGVKTPPMPAYPATADMRGSGVRYTDGSHLNPLPIYSSDAALWYR